MIEQKEKPMLRSTVSLMILALSATPLLAGAPLKGVDVKLGRNPGGMIAARTTAGDGSFDFGVLPKGRYIITLDGSAGTAVLHLQGVAGGAVQKSLAIAKGGATARLPAGGATRLEFSSDGHHPVRGQLSSQD
jgi:hypothetical protein